MRTRTERILESLVLLTVLSLLIISVLSAFQILPEYWAAVGSYSMVPTLEIGDLVLLHPATHNLKTLLGKIIVYHSPLGEDIIHRVIEVEDSYVRTKGDANPVPDPFLVRPDEIRGVVYLVIPYVGFPTVLFKDLGTSSGPVLLLILAVSYVMLLVLLRLLQAHD